MSRTTMTLSGVIAADGTGQLVFSPTGRQNWVVSQASTSCPGAGFAAACEIRNNGEFVCNVHPRKGTAAGLPYVDVRLGTKFTVNWAGAIPGAATQATIMYDDGEG